MLGGTFAARRRNRGSRVRAAWRAAFKASKFSGVRAFFLRLRETGTSSPLRIDSGERESRIPRLVGNPRSNAYGCPAYPRRGGGGWSLVVSVKDPPPDGVVVDDQATTPPGHGLVRAHSRRAAHQACTRSAVVPDQSPVSNVHSIGGTCPASSIRRRLTPYPESRTPLEVHAPDERHPRQGCSRQRADEPTRCAAA